MSNNKANHNGDKTSANLSLSAKQNAYHAVKLANYRASLSLEGIEASTREIPVNKEDRHLLRQALLKKHNQPHNSTEENTNAHESTKETNGVLVNKLSIQGAEQLIDAERDLSELAVMNIEFSEPPYDLSYWCALHKQLFGDLYDWAGQIRTVDIAKGNTRFCASRFIETEAHKLLLKLQEEQFLQKLPRGEFIEKLAEYYSELNALHPFRDGNGRAQRVFFEHIVINAGYSLSYEPISQHEWVNANIHGYHGDNTALTHIFDKCLTYNSMD